MKTKIFTSVIIALLGIFSATAQDKTTVRANSSDISDNLDLRAVATIFGDSKDLEDFERRLNDPELQISNLDLNNDNYVDYLRVVESIEGNAHIIVVQAVLDKDLYQDVATVEVEKDQNNNVTVQVVGDVYMYGANYIYEPVYVTRPVIYTTFWVTSYRPYYSSWYWGYYPTYYTVWHPYPIFRYRNNIVLHINFGHTYHYVTHRRCAYAYNAYYGRRANGYEVRYPNRSFAYRNSGYSNRYELDQNRTVKTRTPGTRQLSASGNSRNSYASSRNNSSYSTRNNNSTRNNSTRSYNQGSNTATTRSNTNTTRSNNRTYAENRSANYRSSGSSATRNSSTRATTNRSYTPSSSSNRSNTNMSRSTNRSSSATQSRSSSGVSRQSGSSTRSTGGSQSNGRSGGGRSGRA
ncbi:hypothetical protein DI487_13965 [Flavobacterium sediminis]|uniref:DUF3300 domain-containing protein n=1 Tax=Flavobacterium sediminis TaxID=2201181 RepID=A0A2U8QXR0_9FLAO|nr:hypothetical protein [Flavobacterium sediminis]AWM14849.1 hypothetical protein DI487_13965 [Flavobacterium sediminis]